MRKERKTNSFIDRRRSNRGFTLVELIVVLAILAILAAIGVTSAVGYINRSKLDKNNQHAITVYQAAQAALSQKVENGTISGWTRDDLMTCNGLVGNGFPTLPGPDGGIVGLENVNDSRHTTVALTYNPNNSNKPSETLRNLLGPYFYDQSVFGGTITVVFDVSVTYQGEGEPLLYSANVLATFYSLENPAEEGWDASYIHSEQSITLDDNEPWKSLPCTLLTCRRSSFVGFFNGTEESLVGPVVVRDDPADAAGTLFTLRNGETLDVTWCVFDEGHDPSITLDFYDASTNELVATIKADESALRAAASSEIQYRYESVTYLVEGEVQTYSAACNITRAYQDGFVEVTLVKPDGSEGSIMVPVTKTVVTGDTRNEITSYLPAGVSSYTTYTLSLDCMITRSAYANSPSSPLYSSARIFGNDPRNVYASITVGNAAQTVEPLYATRAIDDPIYFKEIGKVGEHTAYIYDMYSVIFKNGEVKPSSVGAASSDTTERCVVNTVFGDLNYNNDGVTTNPISGYCSNTANSYDAVITSARHLYNIRRINQSTSTSTYHYHVVRDVYWYYQSTDTTMSASEARVYTSGNDYNSPVKNGNLQVVSFPAISILNSYETLSAETVDPYNGGILCSINNIQMRVASFNTSDTGFGLIGENKGTIYSIRTDNLNIVLANTIDGSPAYKVDKTGDYDRICPDTPITIARGNGNGNSTRYLNDKPVGGLVGLNNGIVGSSQSTICMNNSIVLAGNYWTYGSYTQGTGIIIGCNQGLNLGNNNGDRRSVFGLFEVRGTFAVVSSHYVGGAIGYNRNTDIDAQIVVDGTRTGSEAILLPAETNMSSSLGITTGMSCVISSYQSCGGAIGFAEKTKFNYSGGNGFAYHINGTDSNAISFTGINDSEYTISVTLPANSLIYQNGYYQKYGIGGAIGYMLECKGDFFSIRQNNSGVIVLVNTKEELNKTQNAWNFCGGAVGRDENGTISRFYVDVVNNEGSRIGSFISDRTDTSYTPPSHAGGAFGSVQTANVNQSQNRLYAINAVNNGIIISRAGGPDQGSGGAIGAVGKNIRSTFVISVCNESQSEIITTNYCTNAYSTSGGSGGAIGSVRPNDNTRLSQSSVICVQNHGRIYGRNNVGGAIGFAKECYGCLYVSNNGATVDGSTNVGGVLGVLESGGASGNLSAENISQTIISGNSGIGGVVGTNKGTISSISLVFGNTDDKVTGNENVGGLIGLNSLSVAINSSLNNPVSMNGTVEGGSNVGGIIGNNDTGGAIPNTVYLEITGVVTGTKNIGGAIGYNNAAVTNISVKIDGSITSSSTSTSDNNLGGVIGYNNATLTAFKPVISGTGSITGSGKNVGGFIGYNNGSLTFASETITVPISVNGGENVGGVIGNNNKPVSGLNVTLSGTVQGTKNIGGVIGYNNGGVNFVASTASPLKINNSVSGTENVGGVIGDNHYSVSGLIVTVNSTVQGSKNIGGAIGSNTVAISNDINVQINSNAKVISATQNADNNVGGAIGYNSGSVINVNVNVDGTLTGKGNNLGGAIGNNIGTISNMVVNISGTQQLSGVNNVGGVIGNNTGTVTYSTAVATPIDVRIAVSGTTNVGGVIGYNKGGVNFAATTASPLKINNSVSGTENVGGVIGDNHYSVSGLIVTINSTVQGSKNIGGAIGSNDAAIANNITVAISNTGKVNGTTANADNNVGGVIGSNSGDISSLTVNNAGTLSGRGHNVGGVIGTNSGTITNLLPSVEGTSPITCSGKNVGGVIGYNNGTVTFNTSSGTPFVVNVSVTGGENVGGVIGSNAKPVNGLNVTIGGTVQGTMSVGGAIGSNSSNPAITSNITVTINGIVRVSSGATSAVNNVGGVIGINNGSIGSDTSPVVFSLTVNGTLSGVGKNIGGIIGCNKGTVKNFTPNVSGTSTLSGYRNVGGVIGSNEASVSFNTASATPSVVNLTITGTENVGGVIGSNTKPVSGLNVTVSGTIQGSSCVGGVVAYNSANLSVATSTTSCPISISASITGVTYVGGVIGQQNSGTINGIGTQTAPITLTNVTISGQNGVGGVFGNMKGGTINNGIYITVTSSSITGATNVGGVFGQLSSGTINGIGTQTAPVALTDVTIFGQNGVGGVVGYMNGGTNNSGIYLTVTSSHIDGTSQVGGAIGYLKSGTFKGGIHETLDASYVTGVEAVGGGIGILQGSISGGIEVTLVNNTNIGDIVSGGDYHCIDVGGAIGFVDVNAGINSGRIVVTIEEGMIYAGGTAGIEGGITVDQAGVGGVFGRLGSSSDTSKPNINNWNGNNNNDPYLSLYCELNTPTVCSASSPVGGLVGHMMGGVIRRSYSTAVVTGTNYVGGFVGRFDGGEIWNSYASGHTVDGGYTSDSINVSGSGSDVGGFAGYIGSGVTKVYQCYSTASVRGLNNVGGFVGRIENSTEDIIFTTYCTGLVLQIETADPNPTYVGAYAGYISNIAVLISDSNVTRPHIENQTNKVLQEANSGLPRVGNIEEDSIPDTRLCWAPYGIGEDEYGGRYIRVNGKSAYEVSPFDDGLDLVFPYRTFISYDRGGSIGWFGNHVGDWPVYGQSSVIMLSNENTEVTISDMEYRYGDNSFDPTVTVIYDPAGEHRLLNSQDYQLTFYDDTHAGTARYHIVGIPTRGYGGQINGTYQINPVDLNSNLIEVVITGGDSRDYTGEPITPAVTVSYYNSRLGRAVSVPSAEYEVTYGENINAGVGTITITAVAGANCTGQREIEFTINPVDISGATITLEQSSYPYTGGDIRPAVTSVQVGSLVIPSGGYTVSYSDYINVGTATVTVTAAEGSNFTGSASTTFTITPNMMTDTSVSVDSAVYTGNPVSLVVRCNGVILTEGRDYTVSYPEGQNNTDVATGRIVTITGIGNYAGTVDKYFDIIAESPDPPEITDDTDGSPGDGDSADSSDQTNPVDPPETTDTPAGDG